MIISTKQTDEERGYRDAWAGFAPNNPDKSNDYSTGYNMGKMRRDLTSRLADKYSHMP